MFAKVLASIFLVLMMSLLNSGILILVFSAPKEITWVDDLIHGIAYLSLVAILVWGVRASAKRVWKK